VTRIGLSLGALVAAFALSLPASAGTGSGWRTYRVSTLGARLDLPGSWRDLSSRTPEVGRVISRMAREHPALAPYLRAMRARGGAIAFIAVDVDSRRFLTNLNVIRQRAPTLSQARLRRELVRELRGSGSVRGRIATRTVRTRSGPALEARYVFRSRLTGSAVTGAATQYLLIRKGNLYVLTYSASPRERGRYRGVFVRSARSLRFTR
jgi:hypothetical protein